MGWEGVGSCQREIIPIRTGHDHRQRVVSCKTVMTWKLYKMKTDQRPKVPGKQDSTRWFYMTVYLFTAGNKLHKHGDICNENHRWGESVKGPISVMNMQIQNVPGIMKSTSCIVPTTEVRIYIGNKRLVWLCRTIILIHDCFIRSFNGGILVYHIRSLTIHRSVETNKIYCSQIRDIVWIPAVLTFCN